MSKDTIGSGLLSKLVKFVRNPTSSWSENDSAQTGNKDDSVNKQLLKEMMERKRRNDFVRKREFDMLRKIRKLEAVNGQSQENVGKPSFFQSSMLSPDDRASTLKKIDEIEAQMSMQWWKNKDQGNNTINPVAASSYGGAALTQPPRPASAKASGYMTTVPTQPVSISQIAELMKDPMVAAPAESRSTAESRLTAEDRSTRPTEASPLAGSQSQHQYQASGLMGLSNFTSSPPSAEAPAQQECAAHDAELEEAAILFANGDDAGAEAGLLQFLEPGAPRVNHVDTWLTLFDLYRATGEQDKFEAAALKFLKRFDRSAPQWFCLPNMVKAMTNLKDKAAQNSRTDWICPSVVGVQTVAALNAAMARAAMPWRLDWRNLKSIDPAALDALYKVFAGWVAQPVQLQFLGSAQLQSVLQAATPSGERGTIQKWWLLRMQALRVLNLPDEFEVAALDFCVTYEVSPPAWESARCVCIAMDAQGNAEAGQAIVGEPVSFPSSTINSEAEEDPRLGPQSSQVSLQLLSVELSGYIQGDAIAVLDKLEAKLAGASMVQISCTKLIRVDFSAAGTLLNWVSARQLEDRPVKFSEVNRLVASFFNVIGITEYAKVVVRVD